MLGMAEQGSDALKLHSEFHYFVNGFLLLNKSLLLLHNFFFIFVVEIE